MYTINIMFKHLSCKLHKKKFLIFSRSGTINQVTFLLYRLYECYIDGYLVATSLIASSKSS